MKVICRPTAGRRDQSTNHFLPKKMHSLISDTKICGHLPSHRKQTAFPSTQPRIKKETSATSRFPNYTVVQINVTAAADLYTESSNTGSYIDMDYPSYEETPDAVSTNELYTTASGDTWQLITTTSQGDDFNDSIDAYRTEDTILYGIHIGYPSNLKESAQAELKKILENGIGQN